MKRKTFYALFSRIWVKSINPLAALIKEHKYFEEYMDDDESPRVLLKIKESVNSSELFMNQHPAYDRIINSKIKIKLDYEEATGKVWRRALGPDGTTVGT